VLDVLLLISVAAGFWGQKGSYFPAQEFAAHFNNKKFTKTLSDNIHAFGLFKNRTFETVRGSSCIVSGSKYRVIVDRSYTKLPSSSQAKIQPPDFGPKTSKVSEYSRNRN